jgi:hypothetical protein
MKLKTYIIPNFKTIEVRVEHRYCINEISNKSIGGGGGNGTGNEEEDDAGASIFREGIWDED